MGVVILARSPCGMSCGTCGVSLFGAVNSTVPPIHACVQHDQGNLLDPFLRNLLLGL